MAAILAAILSFAGCGLLTATDYINNTALQGPGGGVVVGGAASPGFKEPEAAPINLVDLFPKAVEKFNVRSRQPVPGQKSFAAEAIYEVEKKYYETFPHNTYVKITYLGSRQNEAERMIKRTIDARYPLDAVAVRRGDRSVDTGYAKDYTGFYAAYAVNGYLIEFHTNFITKLDRYPKKFLDDGWVVFDAVDASIEKGLGG
ncbi:MAG: hypothetical protein ACYC1U_11275 [Candidatus Aquicultorales bacterium]